MKNIDPMELLRDRLRPQGMTQAALAEQLGIKPAYLSDILAKRRQPGPRVLRALGLEKLTTYRRNGKA